MDRRENKDSSNFFKRLTETPDLATLKSPFPRHLAVSGRNPALAPSSTRPVQFNSVNRAPQSSVRPVAIHNVPTTHYPVVRDGVLPVSPVGSNARLAGAHGFAYNTPVPYRSPPEYPSSVQPIRTHPFFASEGRFVPGSTLPAHIVSPNSLRANVASTSPGHLHSWYFVLDAAKGTVSVHGNSTNADGIPVFRRSTAISRAVDSRTLMTSKGSCYQLVGSADVDTMRLKGFPEYLIPYFVEGFPQTWKQLLERHFGGSTAVGGYHGGTGPSSFRTDDLLRPNLVSLNAEDSIEEYGGLETLSSSGLSGSTYINPAKSPESLDVSSKPHTGANSVYGSGSSLFLNRKFGGTIAAAVSSKVEYQDAFRLEDVEEHVDDGDDSNGDSENENEVERITECEEPLSSREESEEPAESISTDLPAIGSIEKYVQKTPKSKSSVTKPLGASPNRLALRSGSRAVSGKTNVAQLQDMFDSASKRLVSGQHALSPTHSTKKRLRKRVLDSSEESSCQNESSQADGADGAESTDDVLDWPLVEIDVRANVDTPSKSIKGMARRGGSTKRFSGTRGSRSSSHTTPTRLAVRRSTRQQPGNESYEGADFDETPALTSGRRVLATERHAARSATSKSSESDDPEAEMRIEQHNNSDGSEELGVAASKAQVMATPKRNSRVAKPKSSKGAVQSESDDNGSPAVDSAGEAGNDDTPQKTPRSAAGSATPKWKAGRRYFRYKEPETPSTSVTRSGRKVRKPQDWWANAQEHLDGSGGVNGSGQKEAKIKYKWGSGEAIVVQDGKRVRLSDFYLQGGDNEVLFGDSGEDKTKSPL